MFGLGYGSEDNAMLFAVSCWLLWKHRNQIVFQQSFGNLEDLMCMVGSTARHIVEAADRRKIVQAGQQRQAWWCPLEKSWIKVNTNRATCAIDNWSTVGGVLQDHNGAWITGF